MDNKTIFSKSAKGLREATGETSKLPRALRNILKEIDGKRTLVDLQEKFSKYSAEDLNEALKGLVDEGYIRETIRADQKPVVPAPSQPVQAPDDDEDDLDFTTLVQPAAKAEPPTVNKSLQDEALLKQQAMRAKAEADAKLKAEAQARASKLMDELARQKVETQARREADEKARAEAAAKARQMAAEKAKLEALKRAKKEAEEKARHEAEALVRAKAEALAKKQAEEKARQEAEARREAEELARKEAEARAQKEAEEKARQEVEAKARRDAEELAKREAEERIRRELEEKLRKEIEEKARLEAQEKAKKEAAEQARREAEEQARKEAEAQEKREAEERIRRELEEKLRREAEEKARQEAEAQAKREAEEKIRLELEERLKKEAEEKARLAAELQARLEVEELARKDAEEKARQEAEHRERKEAEERVRSELEERLKKESEEKVRLAAELQARQQAEEKQRLENEERARTEAEERLKREMEEQLRKENAEKARLEAEARAKKEADELATKEAEAKARYEAEETARKQAADRVRAEAEEKARRDAEKAREEAAVLARQETEEKARLAAEEKARCEAEDRVRKEAEEKAQKEAEEQARAEEEFKASLAAREKARREAEERARHQAEEDEAKREARDQVRRKAEEVAAAKLQDKSERRQLKVGKLITLICIALVLLGLGLVHVISFDGRAAQFETTASEQFGQPVKIEGVHFSLFPRPRWRLNGVTIGGNGQVKVSKIDAVIDPAGLFGGSAAFKSVTLDSPVISEEAVSWLLFGKAKTQGVRLEQVLARNVLLESSNIGLPRFNAKADVAKDGRWLKISLDFSNKDIFADLRPKGESIEFDLNASTFLPPFGGSFVFEDFTAKGSFDASGMTIDDFAGRNYGGSFNGRATLKWVSAWSLEGTVIAKQVDMKKISPDLFSGGRVDGKARYTMQAKEAKSLFSGAHLEGNFVIGQGELSAVDLMHLLQNGGDSGKTGFRQIDGNFVRDGDATRIQQIRLDAGILSASGSAEIDASEGVHGRFATNYKFDNQQSRGSATLSGTLKTPKFSR
jgi:hypothetical protein